MPVWLWPVVFLGLFVPLLVDCLKLEPHETQNHRQYVLMSVCWALIPSVGLTSGLGMSCRFFGGRLARIFGTFVFGFLMTIATAAIVFAGCMCILR